MNKDLERYKELFYKVDCVDEVIVDLKTPEELEEMYELRAKLIESKAETLDIVKRVVDIHVMKHDGKYYLVVDKVMHEITKEEYEQSYGWLESKMINLFGENVTAPNDYYSKEQKDKWYKAFVKWANNEYFGKGAVSGRFCCGCDWCCDLCKQEKMNGCEDCVDTIIEQLKVKNILIDYEDFDFEKWEKEAK